MWCACGYDFETGDRRSVEAKARHAEDRASRSMLIGIAALAVVPFTLFVAIPALGVVPALWVVGTQLVGGAALAIRGSLRRLSARRMLVRAREPLPLPAARVIE